jgi:chemotaxis protein histidine kinase CheA
MDANDEMDDEMDANDGEAASDDEMDADGEFANEGVDASDDEMDANDGEFANEGVDANDGVAANDGDDGRADLVVDHVWRDHPLKEFLEDELANYNIPLDANAMGPSEVWNKYCDREDLYELFDGMVYGAAFKRRLANLRKQVGQGLDRASLDYIAYDTHRRNYPYKEFDAQGNRNWYGSRAEELLEEDMDAGLYPDMKPQALWQSRPEYKLFELQVFRGHVHQYIQTAKYLHTLKTRDGEDRKKKQLKRQKKQKAAEKKAAKQSEKAEKLVEKAAKQAAVAEKAAEKAAAAHAKQVAKEAAALAKQVAKEAAAAARAEKAAQKEIAAAEKAAAKLAKEAAKEAAAAEKAAAKLAKEAAKEAAKNAKAEKAAEKAAQKAQKLAEKAAKGRRRR